jgi:hypothetical protein
MAGAKKRGANPGNTERLPFSVRYETRRPAEGLIYDRVPDRVRDGVLNILEDFASYPWYTANRLGEELYAALDRRPPSPDGIFLNPHPALLVDRLEWDEFCDACQALWKIVREPDRDTLSNRLNALFARHYFGYELRDGLMERVGARVQEEAIAEARGILRDPDLSGPDEQYRKAIAFFNRRPEPECEKCVEEAALAVEGVARVLLNDHSVTLSQALKRLQREKDVHPSLVYLIDKLYAYRGDAGGVGHALTQKKEVRREEAEFALGVSASAIVYLARLFGRGVE